VARLRKQLKEVERSEAAAEAFAKEHASGGSQLSKRVVEAKEAGEAHADATVPQEQPDFSFAPVVQKQQVQYRLGETAVPPLQEAVLESIANAVKDSSYGATRRVNIVGSCDTREDPEVAYERADAVKEWLLERGVPSAKLVVETTAAVRGARHTELQLLDVRGEVTSDMRKRAAELFTRSVLSSPPIAKPMVTDVADVGQSAAASFKAVEASHTEQAVQDAIPPKCVLNEFQETSGGFKKGVRALFSAGENSDPRWVDDASVDVGADCVRLSSFSGKWPTLEVPLPFPVAQSGDAAKYSKRTRTLTVTVA